MYFLHQPLTWAFFLVLAPLLIHLINLMRHRRIKWAAMEFLLQSYKKNRKWIWLKQLLLLLARMAVIAAAVAMLAHLVTKDQWADLFGGQTTHHVVLLDDSYSMSDRVDGQSAFDRADLAIRQIAKRAHLQEGQRQKMTLIRYSRAAEHPAAGDTNESTGVSPENAAPGSPFSDSVARVADMNAVSIDADFDLLLSERQRVSGVTQLATGPGPALELAAQIVEQSVDDRKVIHIVSDFRNDPWDAPEDVKRSLDRLRGAGAELHLVRCVNSPSANLAITQLQPAEGTRAAGVPLFVEVTVKNFASRPAEQVQVKVRSVYLPAPTAADSPDQWRGRIDELPTVLIEHIAPGESALRRVQVYFPTAGQHIVEAELLEDAVAADNRRWCVVDFPASNPVLIVDGDPAGRNANYLSSIFQPGDRVKTGISPSIQPPSFLRDAETESLNRFRAIYLLNVERLDENGVKNLAAYVRDGGGLGIFLGPDCNLGFYNQWYDDGQGLFPVALERQDLVGANLDDAPDLLVEDHPLFRVLLGERNPFVQGIRIDQYVRTPADWNPPSGSTIRVLARLRNRMPLVVERRLGAGRVVAFLTTLAPDWNNWAAEPSFVVVALQLHAYLDSEPRMTRSQLVGSPLDVPLNLSEYQPELRFVLPDPDVNKRRIVAKTAARPDDVATPVAHVLLGSHDVDGGFGETQQGGVYEAWSLTIDGRPDVQRYALNVDTKEGDLSLPDTVALTAKLAPLDVQIHDAAEMIYDASSSPVSSWSQILLLGLVGLLIAEQAVAYWASYHPAPLRGGTR